jgi:uncharacterized protein YegP (UPF0339 family)
MTVDRDYRFQVYRDADNQHRWRFVASNGKIVADSGEGYKTKRALNRSMTILRIYAANAPEVAK